MATPRRVVTATWPVLVGLAGCSGLTGLDGEGDVDGESERLLVASDGVDEVVLLRREHVADVGGVVESGGDSERYAVQVEVTDAGEDSSGVEIYMTASYSSVPRSSVAK